MTNDSKSQSILLHGQQIAKTAGKYPKMIVVHHIKHVILLSLYLVECDNFCRINK